MLAKQVEHKALVAFRKIKSDILELKRSRKKHAEQLQELTLLRLHAKTHYAKESDLHHLAQDVEALAHEHKEFTSARKELTAIRTSYVDRDSIESLRDALEHQVHAFKEDLTSLKKDKNLVRASDLVELEKSMLRPEDIQQVIKDQFKQNYLTAAKVGAELTKIREEFHALQEKMHKVRRETVSFPRWSLVSNLLLLLSLISLGGAGVSVWLLYVQSANFLAIQGVFLLVAGLLIRAGIALRQ